MTVVLRRPAYEVVQQGQAAMNSCLVELSSAGDTAPLPHPRPEVGWFHLHEIKAALVSKLFNVYVLAAAASDLTKFSIAKRSAIVASVGEGSAYSPEDELVRNAPVKAARPRLKLEQSRLHIQSVASPLFRGRMPRDAAKMAALPFAVCSQT